MTLKMWLNERGSKPHEFEVGATFENPGDHETFPRVWSDVIHPNPPSSASSIQKFKPFTDPQQKELLQGKWPKIKKNKSKSKVWIGILKFWPGFWEAWIWVWGFWMLGVSIQAIPSNALHFLKRFQKSYPQRSTAPWSSTGPSVGPVMVWDFPAPVPTPWAKTVNPSPYKNPQHRVGCSQQGLFGHKQKWFHWILIHRHWAQGKTRMCKR